MLAALLTPRTLATAPLCTGGSSVACCWTPTHFKTAALEHTRCLQIQEHEEGKQEGHNGTVATDGRGMSQH